MALSAQDTEKKRKSAQKNRRSSRVRDFPPDDDSREGESRGDRLRHAIQEAGRINEIARRAGIALSTLNSYLAGGEIKLSAAIALAEACNVTIEWLATGKGPMRPGEQPPAQQQPEIPDLATTLNMEILAECVQAAAEQLSRPGRPTPWLSIVRIASLTYNEMLEIEAREKAKAAPPAVKPPHKIEP